jgi:Methyltransferase domain
VSNEALLHNLFRHFRSRRMRLFERTLHISSRTSVLDVGGSPLIWEFAAVQPRLTILNLPSAIERSSRSIQLVAGDARLLPFNDAAFDVVFSNSVIEHIGAQSDQCRFAQEVARVGRQYWIQTPNRHFPIELHMMLPLIHYLPKSWQRRIVNRFTVWEKIVRPTEQFRASYVHHFLDELNLLDAREMKSLFPDAKVISERVLGLSKSLIAVRA